MDFQVTSRNVSTTDSFESIAADADLLYRQITGDITEMEGFLDKPLRVFETLIRRLVTTAKDQFSAFIGSPRLSELAHFTDIHKAKIRLIGKQSYHKVMDIKVDFPAGMDCTYVEAVGLLRHAYTTMNVDEITNLLLGRFENIYRQMSRKQFDEAEQELDDVLSILAAAVEDRGDTTVGELAESTIGRSDERSRQKAAETIFDALNKRSREFVVLDDKKVKTNEKQFGNLFKSMKEWEVVRIGLIEEELQYRVAGTLPSRIETIDENTNNILAMLEDEEGPKGIAEKMAVLVRSLAILHNQFHFALASQMKLEHSYIIGAVKLMSELEK